MQPHQNILNILEGKIKCNFKVQKFDCELS